MKSQGYKVWNQAELWLAMHLYFTCKKQDFSQCSNTMSGISIIKKNDIDGNYYRNEFYFC